MSRRWYQAYVLGGGKEIWRSLEGRLVISPRYPERGGTLIEDAQPITQDEFNAILKERAKEMSACH